MQKDGELTSVGTRKFYRKKKNKEVENIGNSPPSTGKRRKDW